MRAARVRPLRVAYAALMIFTLMAGDFWRNLLSWWGWGALVVLLLVGAVVALVLTRMKLRRLPLALLAFIGLATVSVFWSFYPGATLIGVAGTWATTVAALFLAVLLTWAELLRALGIALRWILGLSLVFELLVAVIVRHPILPFFTDYGNAKLPKAFYWSRDLLVEGGRIQGIQGNANLLALSALLALIVFGIQLAGKSTRRPTTIAWLVLAVAMLALTRSSTVLIATVVTLAVLGVILAVRATSDRSRILVYSGAGVLAAGAVTAALVFQGPLLTLLGKGEGLTGRVGIWDSVVQLAVQRPVFGWGWVSYWAPWVAPFDHLAVINGVTYLQAHNAWLDVWLQLGVIGVVLFAALVVTAFARSWLMAVDRVSPLPGNSAGYRAVALLPALVLTALLVQSLAESRLLIESDWALLACFAIKGKLTPLAVEAAELDPDYATSNGKDPLRQDPPRKSPTQRTRNR